MPAVSSSGASSHRTPTEVDGQLAAPSPVGVRSGLNEEVSSPANPDPRLRLCTLGGALG
jgi:hypothetical protein